MLPPVEDAVLQHNPEFTALYSTLTTAILNPNGSTKNHPATKERDAVHEELKAHRLKAAKHHILTQAISTATPLEAKPIARRGKPPVRVESTGQLPPELLDLLLILPPLLASPQPLSPESAALLLSNPPFVSLPTLLPQLTALVSSNLQSSASSLARIANPTTNPSYLHRSIPTLSGHISGLRESLTANKSTLTKSRLSTAASLLALLTQHTAALTALIRALEAKHSTISRSLELRATEVSQTSQKAEIDSEVALCDARRAVYTPQATAALQNYASHLQDGKMRLGEAIRTALAELEAYGVRLEDAAGEGDGGKERTMREMARVYREMGRQVVDARGDLERLGRA